jgi:hypothetical protein
MPTAKCKMKIFLQCPACEKGEFAVSHIVAGQSFGPWCCESCGTYVEGVREGATFELKILPDLKREKITVTLQSKTVPPITLKLNSWQYIPGTTAAPPLTPERAWDNATYFYNEHTCPTNFMREVAEIIFQGDSDPHGVFEFVSIEFGHVGDEDADHS